MKKYLLVALAAVGLASCVQTEELGVANNKEAIAFDPFVENATKAMHTTESLKSFNVYGTISQIDTNGTKGDYVTTIFDGIPVTKGTNGWGYRSEHTQYWVAGFYYDFAAVVDGTVVCENGLPATISTNLQEQKDVLYATESREFNGGQTSKVSFNFAHLLAKAKFTVKNTISEGKNFVYNVESIIIKNADKDAEYEVASGEWTPTNTYEADFGVATSLAMGANVVSQDVLLLPSNNKDLEIEVKYNLTYNGATLKSETKTLAAVLNIEQGKAYNFVVEFGNPGEEIEFKAEVNDWTNGSVEVFQGVSVPVTTAQELADAIANPEVGEAVLMNDIDLTSTITRSGEESTPVIAKSFVIDGNGKKLTYSGSDRVIDITYNEGNNDNLVVTIKDLTINCSASYCQRGINYNAGGLLIIDNVKFEGTAPTYAVNCPASSDNAVVKIKNNSEVIGNIALNLWGENMKVDVTNSHLISVDNTEAENYSAITLNNDGTYVAEGTVVNIEGGKVIARDEKGEPSYAVRNSTATGCVNISKTTEVVGEIKIPVVIVAYEGYSEFYSFTTVQAAIDKVQADKRGTVRLIKDLVLTEPIEVKACDYNVVLDLNGHNMHMVDTTETGFEMINNAGKLTITGNGKLSVEATINSGWSRSSSVISNTVGGTLVVEGDVVVEHLGGTDMAYGIDNLTNGKGTYAVTTIDGATVKSTYSAIRQFLNGVEATNELYVKNGSTLVSPNRSIFFQDPSANANTGKLVVESGASVTGDVRLSVTEGSTEWPVEVSVAKAALKNGAQVTWNTLPTGYTVLEQDGVWTVKKLVPYYKEGNTYHINTAAGLVEVAALTINGGENIVLEADIDLTGVEFNGLNAFNPENTNTFDGQGHTVSNWTYTGRAYDMGFIKNWVGPIKNLTIKNAILSTGGRSAVIAAKPYGNIENCHVVDCNFQANYWACGLIAGMHNSGNMKNCTATNSSVTSTGGTAAITGVLNETAGVRTYEGCVVSGCTINNSGDDPYGGAAIVGLINIDNATIKFVNCAQSGNTFKGTAKDAFVGYNAGDNTPVTIE